MKKVAKISGLLAVALLSLMIVNLAAYSFKPVAGCPTQEKYSWAFGYLGTIQSVGSAPSFGGGSYSNARTTKFNPLKESDLSTIRQNTLGIEGGNVFKTLECCRQQYSEDILKENRTQLLCGKLEVKKTTTSSGTTYHHAHPRTGITYPAMGSLIIKPVPFNFPQAGGITSSNAIDVAKNNHTLADFFTKNAGMPTTKYALGDMSNIDPDTKAKNPKEKFTLLPENFMRFVFYPHQGLRAELMAHFIAPFAMGNDWDKWKEWGKKFGFVTENTGEMKTLMRQTLINLVNKNDAQAIIDLHSNIYNSLSGQTAEIIGNWWNESVGPTSRRGRIDQIQASLGGEVKCWIWDNAEKTKGHYNYGIGGTVDTPNPYLPTSSEVEIECEKTGLLVDHEREFFKAVSRQNQELWNWKDYIDQEAKNIWNYAIDNSGAKAKAEQQGWATGSALQKQALSKLKK